MSFKYACFISYCHGRNTDYTRTFITELKKALDEGLDQEIREEIYLDTDRLDPGKLYNEALACAICESVCMIVVYSPLYEESSYCRREFEAMRKLEPKRQKLLGKLGRDLGMIIPIVIKGGDNLPPEIQATRQCSDMSKFSLVTPEISRHADFVPEVKKLCKAIVERYQAFKQLNVALDPCQPCSKFILPKEVDCPAWRMAPPRPPFPGRRTSA